MQTKQEHQTSIHMLLSPFSYFRQISEFSPFLPTPQHIVSHTCRVFSPHLETTGQCLTSRHLSWTQGTFPCLSHWPLHSAHPVLRHTKLLIICESLIVLAFSFLLWRIRPHTLPHRRPPTPGALFFLPQDPTQRGALLWLSSWLFSVLLAFYSF